MLLHERQLKPIGEEKGVVHYDPFQISDFLHSGDPIKEDEAKVAVIEMLDTYIYYIIQTRYGSFRKDAEDLHSCAVVKILEDLDGFDPNKGSLTTYFQKSILNACSNYLSSEHHKSTTYYANNAKKVKEAQEWFKSQGMDFTPTDIVKRTGLTRKNVDDALILMKRLEGEGPMNFEGNTSQANRDRGYISPEEEVIKQTQTQLLHDALAELSPKEREVLELQFTLHANKKASNEEIAKRTGITAREVKRTIANAIDRLKSNRPLREFYRGENPYNPRNNSSEIYVDLNALIEENSEWEDWSITHD